MMLNMWGNPNTQLKCFTFWNIRWLLHSSSKESRYNHQRVTVMVSVLTSGRQFGDRIMHDAFWVECSRHGWTLSAEGATATPWSANSLSTDHGQTSWGTSPVSLGPGCNNHHRTSSCNSRVVIRTSFRKQQTFSLLDFLWLSYTFVSFRVSRWLSSVL